MQQNTKICTISENAFQIWLNQHNLGLADIVYVVKWRIFKFTLYGFCLYLIETAKKGGREKGWHAAKDLGWNRTRPLQPKLMYYWEGREYICTKTWSCFALPLQRSSQSIESPSHEGMVGSWWSDCELLSPWLGLHTRHTCTHRGAQYVSVKWVSYTPKTKQFG